MISIFKLIETDVLWIDFKNQTIEIPNAKLNKVEAIQQQTNKI